jgi:hypothetical protein
VYLVFASSALVKCSYLIVGFPDPFLSGLRLPLPSVCLANTPPRQMSSGPPVASDRIQLIYPFVYMLFVSSYRADGRLSSDKVSCIVGCLRAVLPRIGLYCL